jgi:hypothetical protein
MRDPAAIPDFMIGESGEPVAIAHVEELAATLLLLFPRPSGRAQAGWFARSLGAAFARVGPRDHPGRDLPSSVAPAVRADVGAGQRRAPGRGWAAGVGRFMELAAIAESRR